MRDISKYIKSHLGLISPSFRVRAHTLGSQSNRLFSQVGDPEFLGQRQAGLISTEASPLSCERLFFSISLQDLSSLQAQRAGFSSSSQECLSQQIKVWLPQLSLTLIDVFKGPVSKYSNIGVSSLIHVWRQVQIYSLSPTIVFHLTFISEKSFISVLDV